MSDWKELWKQRKTGLQSNQPVDKAIAEQVKAHKRQKVECKANTVAISLPINDDRSDLRNKQQQIETKLLAAGFFDEPAAQDDDACGHAQVTTDNSSTAGAGASPVRIPLKDATEGKATQATVESHKGEISDVPAGCLHRPRTTQLSANGKDGVGPALPEGFFDNQKQDAKARNAMQEYQQKMKEEMEKLQQKIAEELEAQYEESQNSAATWALQREMDELRDMAEAHERLEAVRLRLEEHVRAQSQSSALRRQQPPTEELESDSGSDLEMELAAFDWRQKSSRQHKRQRSTTAAVSTAVQQEEGAEGDSEAEDQAADGDGRAIAEDNSPKAEPIT